MADDPHSSIEERMRPLWIGSNIKLLTSELATPGGFLNLRTVRSLVAGLAED